jgi:hypothetical protein
MLWPLIVASSLQPPTVLTLREITENELTTLAAP